MNTELSKKNRLLIIVISILLHFLLLYFTFIAYVTEQAQTQQQKKITNTHLPFVVLAQSPKPNPTQFQNPTMPVLPLQQSTPQSSQSTTISANVTPTPHLQEHHLEQSPQETNNFQETTAQQKIYEEQTNYARRSRLIVPDRRTATKSQFFPSTLLPRSQEQQTEKSAQLSEKPVMSMQEITKSYFQCVEQERQGAIASKRAGEGTTLQCKLDAQEMATGAYTTKIWNMLRQSMLTHDRIITTNNDVQVPAIVHLTFNKKGALLDCTLQYASADLAVKRVESLLTTAAKSAGLYPQAPAHITADTYKIALPVNIQITKGTHEYNLQYRSK